MASGPSVGTDPLGVRARHSDAEPFSGVLGDAVWVFATIFRRVKKLAANPLGFNANGSAA